MLSYAASAVSAAHAGLIAAPMTAPSASAGLAAPAFLDTHHLLSAYGLIGLLLIIFAECGLLIGFFLPGDTLLFSAGLLMAIGTLSINIWLAVVLVPLAAIAGNLTGYWIGYRVGPKVFHRPQSRMFSPEYVTRSQAFFDRYGPATILLARFVPIVRTVATVMAGVGRMRFGLYALYSVIGGVVWSAGVMLAGYWLGHFQFVRVHVAPLIDPILLAVVLVSVLPATLHWLRSRRRAAPAGSAPAGPADPRIDAPVREAGDRDRG